MENRDSQQLPIRNEISQSDTQNEDEDNQQTQVSMESRDVILLPEVNTVSEHDSQSGHEHNQEETVVDSNTTTFASTSRTPTNLKVVEFYRHVPKSASLSSVCSTGQMKFEDLYTEDLDDLDENLEREAVRLKYETIFRPVHSCSCIQDLHHKRSSTSAQSSDSWSDFAKWLEAFEQPEYYSEACEFCKISTTAPNRNLEMQFAEAQKMLSTQYPHYWRSLLQKYDTNLRSDIYIKETIRKNMVINSCKRLLKEEQRYSEESHRLQIGESGRIRFDGKMSNLNTDFKTACIFMREEYPMLLVHLIKKLEFTKFDIEKKLVEGNKKRIVELAKQSAEELKELDEKFREIENQMNRS